MAHLWSDVCARTGRKPLLGAVLRLELFIKRYKAKSVQLTGFEPVAPSLRQMWPRHSDQGERLSIGVFGAAVERAPPRPPPAVKSSETSRMYGRGKPDSL